uniref:UBX domain-containing protein n=1 Tax=Kalanchoe fedtschenkoi TaxID=63787 RepID=A0A7N0RAB2_KALFE
MSSLIQEMERARAAGEASCTNILQRVATVSRNIVLEVSRAMNQGIQSFKAGIRYNSSQCSHPSASASSQLHIPPQPVAVQDDHGAFLACFEQQHGATHPFFYTCSFEDAVKLARDERKFVFMYLHSPQHPFAQSFCRETLRREVIVQFLDANFVSWGGIAESGEGMRMASAMRPASYPFCAVIAPSPDSSISVLQQIEGPVSADELVEILQRTVEEHGSAFEPLRPEKMSRDMKLGEEQDAPLQAALKIHKDQEKDHARISHPPFLEKPTEASTKRSHDILSSSQAKHKHKSNLKSEVECDTSASTKQGEITKILIRFPDGEKREQGFESTDKIEQLYWFIDSLALPGVGNYQLVSGLPRRTYGIEEMEMTLKEAGLHPRASLFLELL